MSKIVKLNDLKEYNKQLQEAYIKPLESSIEELENAIIGGGESPEEQKEIVLVDIQKMLEEQDTTLFMDLSRQYANGEIVIVGSLYENMAIVNAVGLLSETTAHWVVTAGAWGEPMLEGGEFKPHVEIYGLECDGTQIVIGSGSIENPDLDEYVKNTDYATADKAGVSKVRYEYGITTVNDALRITQVDLSSLSENDLKNADYALTSRYLYKGIKRGITTNTEPMTDDEKASTCEWVGAVQQTKIYPDLYVVYGRASSYGGYAPQEYTFSYTPSHGSFVRWGDPDTLGETEANPYGSLYAPTPKQPFQAANRHYVDNLPDYLTLTDEQKAKWQEMIGGGSAMVYTTYTELKELRDNAQLVPGHFYRITDYVCMTAHIDYVMGEEHRYDIIVQALSENTLSEMARADYHYGDTYFHKSSLNVQCFHSIGNDTYDDSAYVFSDLGIKENWDNVRVPVLYKAILGDDGTFYGTDYGDVFYYVDNYLIDGETYNRWRIIEEQGDAPDGDNYTIDNPSKKYVLTNEVVVNGEFVISDARDAIFQYIILDDSDDNYHNNGLKDSDIFVETGYQENNEGIVVPVLYKTDPAYSEADYGDVFYYMGRYIYQGEEYDRWRKVEDGEWNEYRYALTNIIIENGEFISGIVQPGEHYANLPAWELKYCLDNDEVRFSWANPDGRGVVYYMKDEYNNEAPYDFKNIRFKWHFDNPDNPAEATGLPSWFFDSDNWFYTFSELVEDEDSGDIEIRDRSVYNRSEESGTYSVMNNKIYPIKDDLSYEYSLLPNIFIGIGNYYTCNSNILKTNCFNNIFINKATHNVFENSCVGNSFFLGINGCTFGFGCCYNTFMSDIYECTFGKECGDISIRAGEYLNRVIVGDYCNSIYIYCSIDFGIIKELCESLELYGNESTNEIWSIVLNPHIQNKTINLQPGTTYFSSNYKEIILD